MREISSIQLELFADYHQFYLSDEQTLDTLEDAWNKATTKQMLAVTSSMIGVGTARAMDVPVTIGVFSAEPPLDFDQFDQINECDLEVSSGKIVVAGCTDYFPSAQRIEVESGLYRARILYGNLEQISDDGLEGEDFYVVQLWKTAAPDAVRIVKRRAV